MKKLLTLPFIILTFHTAIAQQDTLHQRNLTLKLPLSHLNGDIFAESAGFGIGVEKMLKPRLSLSQEVGYIFYANRNSIIANGVNDINGLKLVTELRKYIVKKEVPESGFFTSLELRNILTSSTQNESSETGTFENNIFRYRAGLTANFGVLFYWDQHKRGRLTLELIGGAGLGYIYAASDKIDVEARSEYNSGSRFFPWFNMDMKIGYIIR
jgi:hypothetical protein